MKELEVGHVILWKDYPFPDDKEQKELKNFWFIVIGDSGVISEPRNLILVKATTQIHYYTMGNRSTDIIISLEQSYSTYGFTNPCVVDFSWAPKVHEKEYMNKNISENKIEIKGSIPNSFLKDAYDKILNLSRTYTYNQKLIIYTSLNNRGIYGLTQPKKR